MKRSVQEFTVKFTYILYDGRTVKWLCHAHVALNTNPANSLLSETLFNENKLKIMKKYTSVNVRDETKLTELELTRNLRRKEEPIESGALPVRQLLHSTFLNPLMRYF